MAEARSAVEVLAKALWEASERWTLDLPRGFDPDKADEMGAVMVILAALDAAGWAVVPKVATEAMVLAGVVHLVARQDGDAGNLVDAMWPLMLAAAPK